VLLLKKDMVTEKEGPILTSDVLTLCHSFSINQVSLNLHYHQ